MQKGFTLLEMLIALFIISLLLTLALPAWQQHSQQTILQKEQQKLYVFLRQIQARVENSTDIWLLLANRDPVGKRWCLTAQIKNSHLCDCLNPVACPQNVSAHFYYPAFAETVLVSKRYYPLEFTRLSGIRNTASTTCFVLQANQQRTLFSFFNVGSLKLKDNQSLSACVNDEEYTQQSACHYGGWADLLDEKEYEISQLSFDWLSEQKGIKIRLSGRFKRHKQIEYETSMIVPLLNGAKE